MIATRGKCGWLGIPGMHAPTLDDMFDAMRFGKRITIVGTVNAAYRATGQKTLTCAGVMRITGIINGIKREDGSGKCWIVTICRNDNWTFDVFLRTQ